MSTYRHVKPAPLRNATVFVVISLIALGDATWFWLHPTDADHAWPVMSERAVIHSANIQREISSGRCYAVLNTIGKQEVELLVEFMNGTDQFIESALAWILSMLQPNAERRRPVDVGRLLSAARALEMHQLLIASASALHGNTLDIGSSLDFLRGKSISLDTMTSLEEAPVVFRKRCMGGCSVAFTRSNNVVAQYRTIRRSCRGVVVPETFHVKSLHGDFGIPQSYVDGVVNGGVSDLVSLAL
ncbi:hypothetical protein PBRA_007603 [Plasmodiophora brassicae]|nr:hypothetical protein PBRA_007603 [Plasmodiophora brassicae]